MIKEIQFSGYTTQPSDYECQDGELAASINLINEDNHLTPIFQPAELAILPAGCKIVFVHNTNNFTHYILLDTGNNKICWIDADVITDAQTKPVTSTTIQQELDKTNPSHELYTFGTTDLYNVNSIGNTLVALADDGMHYFLWKGGTTGYLYLGTHIPELPLSFGLQGTVVQSEEFNVQFNETESTELDDENKEKVTSQVLAKINKFIAEEATGKGRFIFPFIVRYAYRLYDGSLTMHSAPVLMITATGTVPAVPFESWTKNSKDEYKAVNHCRVLGVMHVLDYAVMIQSRIDSLKNWEDIVRSVDVFISKPIYTYDQNGKIEDIGYHAVDAMTLCKHINQHSSISQITYPLKYQYRELSTLYSFTFFPDDIYRTITYSLKVPGKSVQQIKEDIRTTSQFYLLRSIKLDELTTDRTALNIEEDYLQSLVTREVMTDDYDSHDTLIPKYSFAYNSRLNVANIRKKIYDCYNAGSILSFSDGHILRDGTNLKNMRYEVFFYIKQDGKDIVVQGESCQLADNEPLLYLYYPNVNAYKAVVRKENIYFEIPLEAHSMLNGAFYFGGWEQTDKTTQRPAPSDELAKTIEVQNKIYTSEVNNPFLFPVLGINTVGTGSIIGISAAAKAMSSGQFGQFPLYAFTTEGIWALEVSATGTYSARQPVTRDVCINPDSITQIDTSVLYATNRGVMLISGSQTQCITDNIMTDASFNLLQLTGISQLNDKMQIDATAALQSKNFQNFLLKCQMVYDYTHQRVYIYNPTEEYTYAYVFSLKSKMWGMADSKASSNINAYPDAMAMTHDNKLVTYSTTEQTECKGLFVTRPMKLGAPDTLKTVSELIQRGFFQKGDLATVLYASRDLFNWQLVWSSKDHYLRGFRGTPYKYFRIAGLATLSSGKSIFGASVNFEPRHTNRLR